MFASKLWRCAAGALMLAATVNGYADQPGATLAVVMTNESANQVKVFDTRSQALLQTMSTQGKGAVSGNARGVRQFNGTLVAVVNHESQTVALFKRNGNQLRFHKLVTTTSKPVSIDFGNGHMYVANTNTVDSFRMHHDEVGDLDGTASLRLADGSVPLEGSTAQVGVVSDEQVLVTLKADPAPGTVDVVRLRDGAVIDVLPVSAPAGTLTPFGFSPYPDGTALITLAHSNQDGLFRDGAFVAVVAAGQGAPCWTTRVGKYVFTANAATRTISRLVSTGTNIFIDQPVAAQIQTGGVADLDANSGILGVIDHGNGQSHLSLLAYNKFGELSAIGSTISVGVPNANGIAILGNIDHD